MTTNVDKDNTNIFDNFRRILGTHAECARVVGIPRNSYAAMVNRGRMPKQYVQKLITACQVRQAVKIPTLTESRSVWSAHRSNCEDTTDDERLLDRTRGDLE